MSAHEPRFGTDGVRGIANRELTAHLALKLGIASAVVLGRHSAERHVIVGRDTRLSGDMLEAALNAGLAAMGAQVTNVGVVPTPAVSRMVVMAGATAGAVISASHNPFDDNGIKLLGSDGKKLSDAVEDEIEAAMEEWSRLHKPTGADIGRIQDSRELVQQYVARVRETTRHPLTGLRLVLDCANGATSELAPELFDSLGADVQVTAASPDGVNINEECGSTKPDALQARVREAGADAGLAFDGDGDRVIMADERGGLVDGDHIMAICALGMARRGELPGHAVVATIMSNAGLEVALDSAEIRLIRTDVGDRYVAEEMHRTGAAIGGEQSGHVLFTRLTPTGDGMVTGLQVLGEMVETGRSLSDLASVMATCPQLLRNVRLPSRSDWRSVPELVEAVDRARARLTRPEWLSVRASGTEPVIRVMAQDTDQERVEEVVEELAGLIRIHLAA